MKKYKLVVFDLDGTLTPLRGSACGPTIFELLPNVKEKCAELQRDGVILAIASNQVPERPIEEIRRHLSWVDKQLKIHRSWFVTDKTLWKPNSFLLNVAMWACSLLPEDVLFVGDWDTDRQAAENAGCDFMWAKDFFEWEA